VGKLSGRVVIITGSEKGLGKAYAIAAAADGARVAVCGIEPTESTVNEITAAGGEAFGMFCDVKDPQNVEAVVAETVSRYGGVHGLVNNAALFAKLPVGPMEHIPSETWDRVFATNVRGSFECIRAVLPHMRKAGYGKIVNVCSGVVWLGSTLMLAYCSSKGAVLAMTRSAARELGGDGIRVNAIAPGLTESDGVKEHPWQLQFKEQAVANQSLKRLEQPGDLTGTVKFLLSPDSDFMTGQTLVCDGGGIMH
jgi:NAD(P)-dependent dehydrogenase (short-subunit alcohol dehydrogenase family)